jgi:four helix bundle protein
MKDFRRLRVWGKAHELALLIYRATKCFPKGEAYGLTSQLRRAAVSIPSNIAEGCGRSGDADFARCLQIAVGSASELEYQLLLSNDLDYLEDTDHSDLEGRVVEVKQMLSSLIQKLRAER